MAKGAAEKKIVYDKIMEIFDGAFSPDGKVIRVPIDAGEGIVEVHKLLLVLGKYLHFLSPHSRINHFLP